MIMIMTVSSWILMTQKPLGSPQKELVVVWIMMIIIVIIMIMIIAIIVI